MNYQYQAMKQFQRWHTRSFWYNTRS